MQKKSFLDPENRVGNGSGGLRGETLTFYYLSFIAVVIFLTKQMCAGIKINGPEIR